MQIALNGEYRGMLMEASLRFGNAIIQDLVDVGNTYPLPEEASWTLNEIVVNRGYQFEEYKITTDDGYILTTYRLPGKISDAQSELGQKKQPIFLQHGLLDQGGTWFLTNPKLSLAFQLVDDGYDVWIGNNRGTVISYEHQQYQISDPEYWDFSIHELAKYDVTANVRYVLDQTEHSQIIYIGHSQGTTQWFLAHAIDDSFNQYFKAFIGFAPVIYVGNIHTAFADTAKILQIPELFSLFQSTLFIPPELAIFGEMLIRFLPKTVFCYVESICGFDDDIHVDLSRLPIMAKLDVGGTSSKNVKHWIQMNVQDRVQQYDFGEDGNMQNYGQPNPPEYDLSKLKQNLDNISMRLFSGEKDVFTLEENLNKLLNILPSDAIHTRIEDYNHVDYMWEKDADFYVNREVRIFLRELI